MTPAALEALVARGDESAVFEALRGLSEPERRALAPTAERLRREYWTYRIWRDETPEAVAEHDRSRTSHVAATIAFTATATGAELIRTVLALAPNAVEVLAARKPPWLKE